MFEIYHGDDDFSRKQAIRELSQRLGDAEMASLNTVVLAAADVTPAEVTAQVSAVPFLAEGRMVVVEGLLARFSGRQPAGKTPARGRGRRGQQALGDDSTAQSDSNVFGGWGMLREIASQLPESNILVLSDGAATDSNPLLKHLAPVANVRAFPPLRGNDLENWIRRAVQGEGGRIEPPAARALADAHGSNLWALMGEIEKLLLYVGPRPVSEADVAVMAGSTREENIFAMVDDVIERRYPRARERLERLRLDTGAATPQIFAMIATQIRRLLAAKDSTQRQASRSDLEEAIGTRSDFALRKTVAQSRGFSMSRLKEMHRSILTYDVALKTGELTEDTAVELLIADLCGVGAVSQRPGRQ